MRQLGQSEVVGQRITRVYADPSQSDDSINLCDFVYQIQEGSAFRMPWAYDETEPLMESVKIEPCHAPLCWRRSKRRLLAEKLWSAVITDVMVTEDPAERTPDTGIIQLSSGWFVAQMSSAPIGISPWVNVFPADKILGPMVSVWSKDLRYPDE